MWSEASQDVSGWREVGPGHRVQERRERRSIIETYTGYETRQKVKQKEKKSVESGESGIGNQVQQVQAG